jgi:hypothetical protein
MAKAKQTEATPSSKELIDALVQAIQITKPIEKKTIANRKPGSPWDPKDGSKKLKLKRKMYQHGIMIDPDFHTNEDIELLNKLRPGRYMDGYVKVYKRKDQGIDIDYPIKTASQRLRLVNQFGIRSLADLVSRCIEEAAHPEKYKTEDLEDLG